MSIKKLFISSIVLVITILIFCIGCSIENIERGHINDILNTAKAKAEECYKNGGVEFQTGESGGSSYNVCVYRK